MQRLEGSELHGDVPDGLSWISTHPQHDERIAAIEAQQLEAAAQTEWEPLDLDWDAVLEALKE